MRQRGVMFVAALVLMGSTAVLIGQMRAHQRLGAPGVKTHALPGSIRLSADLPEEVLDYKSEVSEIDSVSFNALPADTSFGCRIYSAADRFQMQLRVVLMGSDRTSLHKPQFCLTGQGWQIDETTETGIPVERPIRYTLPVVKLVATLTQNGQRTSQRGVYVYWYVADDQLSASASGFQRMWSMAEKLITTGVLQRWAYVSCFAPCPQGQEEATFERMKAFIAAAVPEFQLCPKPNGPALAARH